MTPLKDAEIVVTGGTGALGRVVVEQLLAAGARCHVPQGIDLADAPAVERWYAALPPLWASLHIAGGFAGGRIADGDAGLIEQQLRSNTVTAYLCCRAAVISMRARAASAALPAGGRIVNVAARPALEPRLGAGMSAYTASKAAVAALTQALAEELADESIWVNAVAPATLDTPANRAAMPNADFSRWAPLDAVARVIVDLASPANAVVRGAVVPVYGRVR